MGASLQANAPAPSSASRLPHQPPQTEDGFTTEVTEFTEEIPASPGPTVGACLQANTPTPSSASRLPHQTPQTEDGFTTEVTEFTEIKQGEVLSAHGKQDLLEHARRHEKENRLQANSYRFQPPTSSWCAASACCLLRGACCSRGAANKKAPLFRVRLLYVASPRGVEPLLPP